MEKKSVDCLTEGQSLVFIQFRDYVRQNGQTKEQFNDHYLIRFLKARKFDITATKKMWNDHIQWRLDNDVDNIQNYEFKEIDKVREFYPHGYQGQDKKFRPIYIERLGQLRQKELFQHTSEERMLKYFTQAYENLVHKIIPSCQESSNQIVEQSVVILDVKGISMSLYTKNIKSLIKKVSEQSSNNYPEILAQMFIINAPFIFTTIWSGLKLLLDKSTQAKIQILGTNYESKLLQYINIDQLPTFLGGTQPDLLCQNQGVWNPLGFELYGTLEDRKKKNDLKLKDLNIERNHETKNEQEQEQQDQVQNEEQKDQVQNEEQKDQVQNEKQKENENEIENQLENEQQQQQKNIILEKQTKSNHVNEDLDGLENFDIEDCSINQLSTSNDKKSLSQVHENNRSIQK